MFSGSSIPTGVLLILCAFDSALLTKLSEIGIYLAVIGIALIFISVKAVFPSNSTPAAASPPPAQPPGIQHP